MISGLVLASGGASRLGVPVAEAVLGGRRLVDRAAFTLRAGGCDEVLAVVGPAATDVDGARALVTEPDADAGRSLRAGLAHLHPDTEAVLIVPADLPGVVPAEVKAAIGWYRNGASIIITRRAGERSHPVLIARRWIAQFATAAEGEQPGRAFFARNFDDIDFLDYPEPMPDLQSPAELAAAQQYWRQDS
ncbi:MAG TPA: NTP transferase domain-containing protein [Jatrophihabitans sp.]|nr:NTP transferase domain-containing protein [Jatrophihabitans sp.]